MLFIENMSFSKNSLFLSIPLSLSPLFPSLSTLNLDLKVSEEPHGVHHKAKAAAGEHSGQHSGELHNRKQVLLNKNTSYSPYILENDSFYFWTSKYVLSDTLPDTEYDPQDRLLSSHTSYPYILKAL